MTAVVRGLGENVESDVNLDDPDAADLAGVRTKRLLVQVYVISGLICALAGVKPSLGSSPSTTASCLRLPLRITTTSTLLPGLKLPVLEPLLTSPLIRLK